MKLNSNIIPKQKQLITNVQIQELEVLAMDNVELCAFLQREYMENPMLEQTRTKGEYVASDRGETKMEAVAPDDAQIHNYLLEQLDVTKYSNRELNVINYLIECLDDNGYFNIPAKEVAKANHLSEEVVNICLQDLRMLEPYGVFSQDLSHCLLRQAEVLGVCDIYLNEIIMNYLKEVGDGKIGLISRSLGISAFQTKRYINLIESFKPKPLSGFGKENASYIVPDIILSFHNGEWEVVLNDQWMGDYHLNEYYLKLLEKEKEEELVLYFKGKLDRARFLVHSIEQRRSTMRKVGMALLKWQKSYFQGEGELLPMTMADLADEIGVSISTISRCTKGKYLQYPKRTVLMKQLFTAGMVDPIKKIIKEIITEEDKKHPFSDQKIKERLEQRNVQISRRAITKYREELGIKGSFERKQDFV